MREGVQCDDKAHAEQIDEKVESANDYRFHVGPLPTWNRLTAIFSNPLERLP